MDWKKEEWRMKSPVLLKRFKDKFPLMYFFVMGVGGGSLFVFLMRRAYLLFIASELSNVFDCVTVFVAILWVVWRAFRYALRDL